MLLFYLWGTTLGLQCYTCGSMLAYDSSCDDGSLDNKVRYCRMPDPVCYYKETRLRLKIQLKYMLTQRLSVSVDC